MPLMWRHCSVGVFNKKSTLERMNKRYQEYTASAYLPCNHDDVIKWKKIPALLALCEGNPPVTGGFHSQRPVTRSFDVFLDLRLKKRLSKQSRRRWFETSSRSLWRHCNDFSSMISTVGWLVLNRSSFAIQMFASAVPLALWGSYTPNIIWG